MEYTVWLTRVVKNFFTSARTQMTSSGVARLKQLRGPGYHPEIGRGCSHQNVHAYIQIYKFAVNICHKYIRIITYTVCILCTWTTITENAYRRYRSANCNTISSTLSSKFYFNSLSKDMNARGDAGRLTSAF